MGEPYQLVVTQQFAKDMERLDPVVHGQALQVLQTMEGDPDGEPLRGELKGLRSRRVRRRWRIVFRAEGRRVILLLIGTHDVYGQARRRWRR